MVSVGRLSFIVADWLVTCDVAAVWSGDEGSERGYMTQFVEPERVGDRWRGRRVLVTGALGFLGSRLVDALVADGASVVGLDRARASDMSGRTGLARSLASMELVEDGLDDLGRLIHLLSDWQIDAVFHLAAQAIVQEAVVSPLPTYETNVRGTWLLLEACRISGEQKSIVVASSDKAYGTHADLPYRSDSPLLPEFPYDVSKACADLIARSYAVTYEMPVATVRASNTYGPGDYNMSRIIPDTVTASIGDAPVVIRGDGKSVREYTYVDDVADAYIRIAHALWDDRCIGMAFNVGSGDVISTLELVRMIMRQAGRTDEPHILGEVQSEILTQYVDSGVIRSVLEWIPRVSLKSGISRTVQWYRESM